MADDRDAEMTERLERVETKVDHLEVRFDRVEGRFDVLEVRFDKLETRVDRLEANVDVGFEQMRGEFRTLAELVTAGFEAMDRRFAETTKALQTRLEDHDGVLGNHGKRIIALERRRKTSG